MYNPFFLWISRVFKTTGRKSRVTSEQKRRKRLEVEMLEERITPVGGTWTALNNPAPAAGAVMEIMSNGDVMMKSAGIYEPESATWYVLTPDSSGSYVDGTWSTAASMNVARQYSGDTVLMNGDLLVIGGIFASDTGYYSGSGEIYNPTTNVWTPIAEYPGLDNEFGAEDTFVLPSGSVLTGDYQDNAQGVSQTYLYNPTTNTWSPTTGAKLYGDQSPYESWTELPNGNILTYDLYDQKPGDTQSSQMYNPSSGLWEYAGSVPVQVQTTSPYYGLGPNVTLPNGKALQLGSDGLTALYTDNSNPALLGAWAPGPTIPDGDGANLAPAAVLTNGDVLIEAGNHYGELGYEYNNSSEFDEYNLQTNTISTLVSEGVTIPAGLQAIMTYGPYSTHMLELPTGQILFDSLASDQLYVFTPNNPAPQNSWKPTITSFPGAAFGGDTYTLHGTQLNGMDQGAYYGFGDQMDSNRPLAYLDDGAGDIYYTTTSNWSTTEVQTGNLPEMVSVTVPLTVPSGTYKLYVDVNGITSNPVTVVVTQPTPPQITSVDTATFIEGVNSSFDVTDTGVPTPTLSYTGTLPTGLTFDTTTGVISGAATELGTYQIKITATNGDPPNAMQTLTITVVLGPVSAQNSQVTVAPSIIEAGGTAIVELISENAGGYQMNTGGLTVTFGLANSTGGQGVFSAVTDNGDGTYTANFVGTVAGINTITAFIDGQPVTSTLPTIEIIPGALSLANSIVTVNPEGIGSGTTALITLQAEDAFGNDIEENTTTAFAVTTTSQTSMIVNTAFGFPLTTPYVVTIGSEELQVVNATTPTAEIDEANGVKAADSSITVTSSAGFPAVPFIITIDKEEMLVTAEVGDVWTVTRGYNGTQVGAHADGATVTGPALIDWTVDRGYNNTTPGVYNAGTAISGYGGYTVVFSLEASNGGQGIIGNTMDYADGVYTADITGTLLGDNAVTASIDGVPITSEPAAIKIIPGPANLANSFITLNPSTIAAGGTTTVTLHAVDVNGNYDVTGGLGVTFFLNSGSGAFGSFGPVTDNGNGTYTAVFTGQVVGTNSISATINSEYMTPTATISQSGGLAATGTSLTVSSSAGLPTALPFLVEIDEEDLEVTAEATPTTTLVSLTGTSLTVSSSAGFPETPFVIKVGSELMQVTAESGTGNVNWTVTRGFDDSIPGSYSAGATVTGPAGVDWTVVRAFNGTTSATHSDGAPISGPAVTVIPGAYSLSKSKVTLASSSIASGTTTTVTLQTEDAYGNDLTSGGLTVGFALGNSSGGGQGTFGPVTYVGNGQYTAVFTGTSVGSNTVTATIDGGPVTSTAPVISVTSGAVSLSQSFVEVSPASITSGSTSTITLISRDASGNNLPTGGLTVTFGLGSASGGLGTFGPVIDNGHGAYTTTFTGTLAGINTVTAMINGQPVTSTAPQITIVPGAPSVAQSIVTVSPSTIASGSTLSVNLQTKDLNGNNVLTGGQTVTFSLVNGTGAQGTFGTVHDNGNGTYTALFTGTIAGTNEITATINSLPLTSTPANVTVNPGAYSLTKSVVSIPSPIVSGTMTTITLQAKDANGNNLITGGLSVQFALGNPASGGHGVIGSASYSGNGMYTATFTATTAGLNTITATIDGQTVTSTAPITVTAGAYSLATSVVTVTPNTVAEGNTTEVTLQTEDAAGNDLTTGGQTVTFGLGSGAGQGTFGMVAYIGNGQYAATFTGTTVGANTITATINGSAVTSTAPTVTVQVGSVSLSQSQVTIAPSSVPSGTTATVTLQTKDAAGNNETTGGQTVVFGLGGGAGQGTLSSATYIGNGQYAATFTGTVAGNNTITATISGQAVTSTAPTVSVTLGSFSLSGTTVTVSPASVASGSTTTVTLQASDFGGNALSTSGLNVTFGLVGTATGTFGTVTYNGNGSYSATFTGTIAGTSTVTATVNNQAVTSPAPTVTVTPGVYSLSSSVASVSPNPVQSGNTTTVTLQTKDAAGNDLTSGGQAVAFSLSGGTAGGSFGTVSYIGNGAYTATFTGTIAGSSPITTTINGAPVTSTSPSVTVTPGVISLSQSSVSVLSNSLVSGSTTTVTLQTKDAAGNDETSGTATVVFGLGNGTAEGTFGTVTYAGNGAYTALFTGTIAGSNTITATINNGAVTSTPPTISVTVGALSLSGSTLTASPASITSGSSTTVTLQARDAGGNPLSTAGLNVVFSLTGAGTLGNVTYTGNGGYSATFTGIVAETSTVTATINNSPVTSAPATVTVTPGALSLSNSILTVTPSSVNVGATETVTLQTKDANGNNLATGGQTVQFGMTNLSIGSLGNVTYIGGGTYLATLVTTAAGTSTITAIVNGNAVVSRAQATVVGTASTLTSTAQATPTTILAGQTTTIVVVARDALGTQEPTGGLAVTFSVYSGSSGQGALSAVTDNGNGTYTVTFTGTAVGEAAISASINGEGLTNGTVIVTINTVSVYSNAAYTNAYLAMEYALQAYTTGTGSYGTYVYMYYSFADAYYANVYDSNGQTALAKDYAYYAYYYGYLGYFYAGQDYNASGGASTNSNYASYYGYLDWNYSYYTAEGL